MSRKFRAFLSFNFQWYLLILIGVIFFFYYVFTIIRTPTYDEKIVIFIGVDYIESERLEKDLYSGFDDTIIKEVFVDYSNPLDDDFAIVFSTRGTVNTDILILPKDYIKESSYSNFFIKFSDEDIDFDGEFVMNSNGDIYGINVTKFISDYTNSKDDFYLFFNKKSNKVGLLNGISSNDFALDIIKNFK